MGISESIQRDQDKISIYPQFIPNGLYYISFQSDDKVLASKSFVVN